MYMIWLQLFAARDKIEKTAEVAIEVVDTVAEAAEKVAGEVAGAFPGNDGLREAASKIKTVADEIEEDAEKAEALIEKVSCTTQSVFFSGNKREHVTLGLFSTAADSVATT
jgi:DNA-binding ferritin-like protein